jgi:hypothetical protein
LFFQLIKDADRTLQVPFLALIFEFPDCCTEIASFFNAKPAA